MTTNEPLRPRFRKSLDYQGMLHCNGVNHSDTVQLGECATCGAEVGRNDKGRVIDVFHRHTEYREFKTFRCWLPSHECDPLRAARWAEATRVSLEKGELIVDQHVTVTKGRKIAKGTEGVIRWIGEGDYGLRVGIAVEGHEKLIYTAATNVTATNQLPVADAEIVADAPKAAPARRATGSHADCTHEATKAARAACRKARNA
jgi:hypothetical protein